jgi:hypothetical protein
MTLGGRAHAHPPGAVRGKTRKLDANWPIAPQIHALCEVSGSEKRPRASAGPPNSRPQTRISAWNLLGCHRIFERRKGRAGSAPHPSVTVLSVNKALTISGSLGRFLIPVASRRSARIRLGFPNGTAARACSAMRSVLLLLLVMPVAHTTPKMRAVNRLSRLRGSQHRGIVTFRVMKPRYCRSPAGFEFFHADRFISLQWF